MSTTRVSVHAWTSLGGAIALLCGACSGYPGVPATGAAIPHCDKVAQIEAPAALYRDTPIYVENEMPTDAVSAWASTKPGFEELWIDREHHGWITVAFSQDAPARQAELASAFPDVGVVAVEVPWTKRELVALQQKVVAEAQGLVAGSGIRTNYGVVSIYVPVLKPDVVAQVEARFGGLRVCMEGMDPRDAPVEGPQQPSGDGWRLLADQDETGSPYRTGIAADTESLAALWSTAGMAAAIPTVDFQSEVVIWFGAVHGSSCPRLRLDDVVVDKEKALLYPQITSLDVGVCTADAIGHAYLVAVVRSQLPAGRFTIQLQSEEPPPGAMDEKTIVDADLSVPGATVSAADLHSAPPPPNEARVESGGSIEPGYPWRYRLPVRCGIEWLGEINNTWWRAHVPDGTSAWVPDAWRAVVEEGGSVDLTITLETEPGPVITATANLVDIAYQASPDDGPPCP